MAMVRTRRLALGALPAALETLPLPPREVDSVIYTTPAGYRAIVRDVWFASATPTTSDLSMGVLTPDSKLYWFYRAPWPSGAKSVHAIMDQVLEPGDRLYLYSAQTLLVWAVSGAELLL